MSATGHQLEEVQELTVAMAGRQASVT